jgi:hypothetical protein
MAACCRPAPGLRPFSGHPMRSMACNCQQACRQDSCCLENCMRVERGTWGPEDGGSVRSGWQELNIFIMDYGYAHPKGELNVA